MTVAPNADQFEAWNGDSGERWVASADRRDAVLAPIGDVLLQRAAVEPGEAVVDIGCGCGATSIAAAGATGPAGAVVGVDLSAPMLEVGRRRADLAGLAQLQFRQGDAQVDELGRRFDVAISRFGTMFFDDPVAAFANVANHLRPSGRLCIVTWQPLVANEWLMLPGAALLEFGTLPESTDDGAPGMFAQADPAVIRSVLGAAGFVDVVSEPASVPIRVGTSIEEAVEHLADSGPGRAVLDTVAAEHREAALAAVAAVLVDRFDPATGVSLGAAVWVTTAHVDTGSA